MSLLTLVIIQSVIGVVCIIPAFCLQMASIMGACNAVGHLRLATFIVALALALPFVLIGSLALMWISYALSWEQVAITFLILPWFTFGLIVASVLLLFQRLGRKE